MEKQENLKSRQLKIVIIVLAVLLVCSVGALAGRYIYVAYFAKEQATVTVPDNQIGDPATQNLAQDQIDASISAGNTSSAAAAEANTVHQQESTTVQTTGSNAGSQEQTAQLLEFFEGKAQANEPFTVQNMLPGDRVTQYYCVRVHHDRETVLFFSADVTEETKNLSDVLQVRVTDPETGKVLCDAPFSEIKEKEFSVTLPENTQQQSDVYYQIDVFVDTSVDNAYQGATLKADFNWYIKDTSSLIPSPGTGTAGDIALWVTACTAALLLVVLLLAKRQKEGQHGQA